MTGRVAHNSKTTKTIVASDAGSPGTFVFSDSTFFPIDDARAGRRASGPVPATWALLARGALAMRPRPASAGGTVGS